MLVGEQCTVSVDAPDSDAKPHSPRVHVERLGSTGHFVGQIATEKPFDVLCNKLDCVGHLCGVASARVSGSERENRRSVAVRRTGPWI